MSSATNISNTFNSCRSIMLIRIGPTDGTCSGYSIYLAYCHLNHQAIVHLFNSLPNMTTTRTLTLIGNPGVKKLTNDEKLIATDKNWKLALT